jgi:hypothetical protein
MHSVPSASASIYAATTPASATGAKPGAKGLAGAEGFEPPDGGIKTRCLTAWRRPNCLTYANSVSY